MSACESCGQNPASVNVAFPGADPFLVCSGCCEGHFDRAVYESWVEDIYGEAIA